MDSSPFGVFSELAMELNELCKKMKEKIVRKGEYKTPQRAE
jgi:hypothetical protein